MKKARRYLEQQLKLPELRLDVVKEQLSKLVEEVSKTASYVFHPDVPVEKPLSKRQLTLEYVAYHSGSE